jgi:hypothetical protein
MSLPRCRSRRTRPHQRRSNHIYNAEDIDKAQVAVKAFEVRLRRQVPQGGRQNHR